eukprot:5766007-Pyramimonas_sp.AAC.1
MSMAAQQATQAVYDNAERTTAEKEQPLRGEMMGYFAKLQKEAALKDEELEDAKRKVAHADQRILGAEKCTRQVERNACMVAEKSKQMAELEVAH